MFGFMTRYVNTKYLSMFALAASFVLISIFGIGFETIAGLSVIAAIAGFCTNAGVVGLFALMASMLPTDLRAGGTGFIIGMGRGGAALGPVVAGLVFASGAGLLAVSILMAMGSAVAFLALIGLRYNRSQHAS
jgi:MFS family permease